MLRISRVLIVDDDPIVLTLLSRLVTSHLKQLLVETADSPYMALDRIKTNAYDVVISDVRMPGMTGLDLASRIGTISPCTSIVLISETLDHSDQVWSCDIFAYLEKPIDPDLFLRTVSDALEKGRPQCLAGEEAKAVELALYSHCYGD
jgi:DNA-binding NtrC family response regulator